MTAHDNGRWLVLLDGPEPDGRRFVNRKRAARWARRMKAEGHSPLLFDMTVMLSEIKPEEFE